MKSILISGGNGNLAKMIRTNLSNEFNITSITRADFDMIDGKAIESYLSDKHFDILVHTAIIGGRRTKEETADVVYQNLLMFENFMKFAHKFEIIINFDSGAIYDRETDIYCRTEESLVSVPKDYYGFSKYLIYKRSLQYNNVFNFRIFNIFHAREEDNRFIKSCFLAQRNKTHVTIFKDKWFDFMYEDDFIKIVRYYLTAPISDLKKTINLSYQTKYKLSDIAKILINNELIDIVDPITSHNYCGNGDLLLQMGIPMDGLESGIKKYSALIDALP
jgi:nucleoside-diphosphate-sugar epimerase